MGDKTHRTSKCHLIGDTDQEDQRARRENRMKVIPSDTSDCFLQKSFTAVQVSNAHEITNKNEEMQSPICQFLNTTLLCCLRVNDRDMGSFFPRTLALQRGAPLQSQSVALWFCQMLCYTVTHHIPIERQYC